MARGLGGVKTLQISNETRLAIINNPVFYQIDIFRPSKQIYLEMFALYSMLFDNHIETGPVLNYEDFEVCIVEICTETQTMLVDDYVKKLIDLFVTKE